MFVFFLAPFFLVKETQQENMDSETGDWFWVFAGSGWWFDSGLLVKPMLGNRVKI